MVAARNIVSMIIYIRVYGKAMELPTVRETAGLSSAPIVPIEYNK